MVWRAAVLGEARMASWGVRRGGRVPRLFLVPQRCALAGGLAGPRSCRSAAAGFWDPLSGSETTSSVLSRRALRFSSKRRVLD